MLGKIISASTGLPLLKMAIEKTIGYKIFDYELIYKLKKREIWFRVWKSEGSEPKLGPYDKPEYICKIFDSKLKQNGLDKDCIEIVTLKYSELALNVFTDTQDNGRIKSTYKL